MSEESVAVRIAGREYKIRSDGDPDSLREIAGYVDRAMQRVQQRTGTVDTLDVAVLTCLNLAREILALREARTPSDSIAIEEAKLRSLIENVEQVLGSETGSILGSASGDEIENVASNREEPVTPDAANAEEEGGGERARTLELPSVDALRDRASKAAQAANGIAEDSDPEAGIETLDARVASGGRDRAS